MTFEELQQAGFNEKEIWQYVGQQRRMLKEAGFSESEILEGLGLGIEPPSFWKEVVEPTLMPGKQLWEAALRPGATVEEMAPAALGTAFGVTGGGLVSPLARQLSRFKTERIIKKGKLAEPEVAPLEVATPEVAPYREPRPSGLETFEREPFQAPELTPRIPGFQETAVPKPKLPGEELAAGLVKESPEFKLYPSEALPTPEVAFSKERLATEQAVKKEAEVFQQGEKEVKQAKTPEERQEAIKARTERNKKAKDAVSQAIASEKQALVDELGKDTDTLFGTVRQRGLDELRILQEGLQTGEFVRTQKGAIVRKAAPEAPKVEGGVTPGSSILRKAPKGDIEIVRLPVEIQLTDNEIIAARAHEILTGGRTTETSKLLTSAQETVRGLPRPTMERIARILEERGYRDAPLETQARAVEYLKREQPLPTYHAELPLPPAPDIAYRPAPEFYERTRFGEKPKFEPVKPPEVLKPPRPLKPEKAKIEGYETFDDLWQATEAPGKVASKGTASKEVIQQNLDAITNTVASKGNWLQQIGRSIQATIFPPQSLGGTKPGTQAWDTLLRNDRLRAKAAQSFKDKGNAAFEGLTEEQSYEVVRQIWGQSDRQTEAMLPPVVKGAREKMKRATDYVARVLKIKDKQASYFPAGTQNETAIARFEAMATRLEGEMKRLNGAVDYTDLITAVRQTANDIRDYGFFPREIFERLPKEVQARLRLKRDYKPHLDDFREAGIGPKGLWNLYSESAAKEMAVNHLLDEITPILPTLPPETGRWVLSMVRSFMGGEASTPIISGTVKAVTGTQAVAKLGLDPTMVYLQATQPVIFGFSKYPRDFVGATRFVIAHPHDAIKIARRAGTTISVQNEAEIVRFSDALKSAPDKVVETALIFVNKPEWLNRLIMANTGYFRATRMGVKGIARMDVARHVDAEVNFSYAPWARPSIIRQQGAAEAQRALATMMGQMKTFILNANYRYWSSIARPQEHLLMNAGLFMFGGPEAVPYILALDRAGVLDSEKLREYKGYPTNLPELVGVNLAPRMEFMFRTANAVLSSDYRNLPLRAVEDIGGLMYDSMTDMYEATKNWARGNKVNIERLLPSIPFGVGIKRRLAAKETELRTPEGKMIAPLTVEDRIKLAIGAMPAEVGRRFRETQRVEPQRARLKSIFNDRMEAVDFALNRDNKQDTDIAIERLIEFFNTYPDYAPEDLVGALQERSKKYNEDLYERLINTARGPQEKAMLTERFAPLLQR